MFGACSAHGGDQKSVKKFWFRGLNGDDHSEDLGEVENIILKWMSEKLSWRVWIGFIWLRIGTGSRLL
jgi:hypothetical protein